MNWPKGSAFLSRESTTSYWSAGELAQIPRSGFRGFWELRSSFGLICKPRTKSAECWPSKVTRLIVSNRAPRRHQADSPRPVFPVDRRRLFLLARSGPPRHDRRRDPAPRTELPPHLRPDRLCPLHHVFQHLVHNILLKDSQIPVALQILFQGLQLKTILIGHVTDIQNSKIRQPGFGTHRRKLRIIDENLVARKLVRPSLNGGKFIIEPRGSVLRRITWRIRHTSILSFLLYRAHRRT